MRVAGRVFRRTFEADPDLEFAYGWDRRNAYDQKVRGVVRARVSVGYVYSSSRTSCPTPASGPNVFWVTRVVRLRGFDVDISGVGEGWNLEVHHHYNAEQGKRKICSLGNVLPKEKAMYVVYLSSGKCT